MRHVYYITLGMLLAARPTAAEDLTPMVDATVRQAAANVSQIIAHRGASAERS